MDKFDKKKIYLDYLKSLNVNEAYSVSDDIHPWFDLIYNSIKKQIKSFINDLKNDKESYEKDKTINKEIIKCYNTETTVPNINNIIKKYIPKENKLKLKDLNIKVELTILPEENFTNNIEETVAYYTDHYTNYDGLYLRNGEIYINVYLPDVILTDNIDKVLNDYDINERLNITISHELDHVFEFFNRKQLSDDKYFSEMVLQQIQEVVQDNEFSEFSEYFQVFFELCYRSLSFEINARITEVYYFLKDKHIDNINDFWYYVKDSSAWKELYYLKLFDPKKFYNDFELDKSDEEIIKILNTKNINNREYDKHPLKFLVMRYWISIFKTLIDYVNKEQNEHLKKVTDNMVNNPVEFFKFYDKKFKKSWEFFYKRVVKMSTKYVKSEN